MCLEQSKEKKVKVCATEWLKRVGNEHMRVNRVYVCVLACMCAYVQVSVMLRGHLLDGDRHIDSANLLVVAVLMLEQKSCKQHRIFLLHKSKKIWQKSVCC